MAHNYVSPADKLSRQILKMANKSRPGRPITQAAIIAWFGDETAVAIQAAIAHSVSEGWLTGSENAWQLTVSGAAMGRRSRAGVMNRSRIF